MIFHFSEFTPDVVYSFSQDPIVAREAVEDKSLATGPSVGLGPFLFKRWDKGLKLVFTKNPNYWDNGKPYVDELDILFMEDYTTRRQALMAGDVDIVHWVENADLDSIGKQPGINIDKNGVLDVADYLEINTSSKLMSNVKMRQAVKYAFDRKELNALFNAGLTDNISAPMYRSDPFFNPAWDYQQDIEKAKALVKEVYPNGMTEKLTILGAPMEKQVSELMSAQLQVVGIPSEVQIIDNSSYVDKVMHNTEWGDIGYIGDFFDIGNPLFWWAKYYVKDAALGNIIGHWQNDQVLSLIADYKKPHTAEERKKIADQVYTIVNDQVPMIWQGIELKTGAFKDYVTGYFQNGGGYVFFQDIRMNNQQ